MCLPQRKIYLNLNYITMYKNERTFLVFKWVWRNGSRKRTGWRVGIGRNHRWAGRCRCSRSWGTGSRARYTVKIRGGQQTGDIFDILPRRRNLTSLKKGFQTVLQHGTFFLIFLPWRSSAFHFRLVFAKSGPAEGPVVPRQNSILVASSIGWTLYDFPQWQWCRSSERK